MLARVASEQGALLEESSMLEGNAREAALRFGKQRLRWATDGRRHYLSLHTPKVATRLHVGRPDEIGSPQRVARSIGGVPVYLPDTPDDNSRPYNEATVRWLADPVNIGLLERLGLSTGEWASVSANWTIASLSAGGEGTDLQRVDTLLQIVQSATDPQATWLREPRLTAASIPTQFRGLLPMIRKWAIDDDSIRGDRLSRARTSTLLSLWSEVGPRLSEIDDYLDSIGQSASYETLKVGRLAEASVEAHVELERRGVDLPPLGPRGG